MYLENEVSEQKIIKEKFIITEKGRIYINEILTAKGTNYDVAIKTTKS